MNQRAWLVAIASIAAGAAAARAEPAAIMVLPAESAPVDPAITAAIVRAAKTVSPSVTAGSASLADTAFMAGCDPAEATCLDAVGAQLGVQQLVIVRTRGEHASTTVDVTATRPGTAPTHRTFIVGPDRSTGELEAGIPALLGAAPHTAGAAPLTGGVTDEGTAHAAPRGALVIAIGGAVLAGAGFAMWAVASSKQHAIDDAPTATPADLDHLADLERSGRSYASAGNGLVIGGAVAAVAGVAWILVDRRRRSHVRIAPVAGPQQAGLALEGAW